MRGVPCSERTPNEDLEDASNYCPKDYNSGSGSLPPCGSPIHLKTGGPCLEIGKEDKSSNRLISGYQYYEIFNNESANEALNNVFNNHNDDKDYRDRMRKNISRYTVENNNLISDYNMLLEDLVNGKFTRRKYDWKTNSIS